MYPLIWCRMEVPPVIVRMRIMGDGMVGSSRRRKKRNTRETKSHGRGRRMRRRRKVPIRQPHPRQVPPTPLSLCSATISSALKVHHTYLHHRLYSGMLVVKTSPEKKCTSLGIPRHHRRSHQERDPKYQTVPMEDVVQCLQFPTRARAALRTRIRGSPEYFPTLHGVHHPNQTLEMVHVPVAWLSTERRPIPPTLTTVMTLVTLKDTIRRTGTRTTMEMMIVTMMKIIKIAATSRT
ncbi:hypothetical protein QBC43DRAFT_327060 [Cladorrhinum sp. PSN259]|nr:hypothetical protein QBC43DRAFT_327060 [Cladorrhinum sp. PSN259]